MMRSLSSAVSGLKAHQTRMDVIGDNIANVNTYGFKSSRVTFTDVYYQTLSGAAGPRAGASGGTNPTQIGYGAKIGTIDVLNTIGSPTATNQWGDVYISGDGYIAVQNAKGAIQYTRLGVLGFDSAGQLIDAGGNLVLGIPVDAVTNELKVNPDGTISGDELAPIQVDIDLLNQMTGIAISSDGKIIGTLPGDQSFTVSTTAPGWVNNVFLSEDCDIVGAIKYMRSYAYDTGAPACFTNITMVNPLNASNASGGATPGEVTWSYNDVTNELTATWHDGTSPQSATAQYKENSVLEFVSTEDNKTVIMTVQTNGNDPLDDFWDTSVPGPLTPKTTFVDSLVAMGSYTNGKSFSEAIPIAGLTAGGNAVFSTDGGTITIALSDGSTPGSVAFNSANIDFEVWSLGRVNNDDIQIYTIGAIAIANFANPSGMNHIGNSYFSATANSGEPVYGMAGVVGGETEAGYLEMSNVDLSQEFTDMITTQRGFQANSRIITVSDEMLQELVNLKR